MSDPAQGRCRSRSLAEKQDAILLNLKQEVAARILVKSLRKPSDREETSVWDRLFVWYGIRVFLPDDF